MIPLAERVGLIDPIGQWVLRRACTDFVSWHRDPAPQDTSRSTSPPGRSCAPRLPPTSLARSRTPASARTSCTSKVTESALLDDATTACAVLDDVKSSGVRLSLDDFGTGYACPDLPQILPLRRGQDRRVASPPTSAPTQPPD
jgi:EAL domain-containing protein (putative c-di-GMP-specific phosphodiesterase class I)